MVHDYLVERGIRDRSSISLVSPLPVPIPPSPAASDALLRAFAARGIGWFPGQVIRALDPTTKTTQFADGTELAFDLFLGVPTHRVPAVVADSGLAVDGWIPVNPLTLETAFPGVYAVGDVTSVGTPKAGVFSERQASVAAQHIIAQLREGSSSAEYDGFGLCYLEFGHHQVARVEVTFMSGHAPHGTYAEPSVEIADEKSVYGASRIQRWFDRSWTTLPVDA